LRRKYKVANNAPYYSTYRSGYTGPSERIGGSSPYHIDLKILSELPLDDQIRALDSLASKYKELGRSIEFSNAGIGGRRWDINATPEQKKALFNAATSAHAARPGYNSLDFYVPLTGEDRYGKSVEGASIFIPGIEGGKIRRGSGGDYGYYSEALDPSGRVVFRVGHGDVNRPEAEGDIAVGKQPAAGKTTEELLEEYIAVLTKPREESFESSYTGPDPESFTKANDRIDDLYMQLMAKRAYQDAQEPEKIKAPRENAAFTVAKAMGQASFGRPRSII